MPQTANTLVAKKSIADFFVVLDVFLFFVLDVLSNNFLVLDVLFRTVFV